MTTVWHGCSFLSARAMMSEILSSASGTRPENRVFLDCPLYSPRRPKVVKKIAVVPTLLTLGNAICGFIAIAFASKIHPGVSPADCDFYFAVAGWVLLAAMVFDMFDGYVARLSKTASKFGG